MNFPGYVVRSLDVSSVASMVQRDSTSERWDSFAKFKGQGLIKLVISQAQLFSVDFLTLNTRIELKF